MKVNLNLNRPNINNNIKFEGYKPTKSEYGDKEYEFNYVYDDSKYDCYLELYSVDQDENNNYRITNILDNFNSIEDKSENKERGIKLKSGNATKVDLAADYGIAPDEPFAYHYKLYPKGNHSAPPIYMLDPGNIINEAQNTHNAYDVYNIITDRAPSVSKGGAMKLIIPDCHNVIWKYNDNNKIVMKSPEEIVDVMSSSKNFANKIGGSLAGIEKSLDNGELDKFTRIITLPLFTDDSLTAHSYWNKNCFQMAQSLGNINNYASIQRKMFAKGMNLVSDGAYVNEGLEGVHFQHILKWGEKSPYFNWFRITGLKDSPLSLGVFGKNTSHVTHRLVNSPYKFVENDNGIVSIKPSHGEYDPKKPTYIQIYDDRLTNAENLSNKELLKAYEKFDKNYLDINNHNDTVAPYSFRINPETYKKNVEKLNEYNKTLPEIERIRLHSGQGTKNVTQFEYFGLDGKHESGFYTWDANPDIAKLNYIFSHTDTQDLLNIGNPRERAAKTALLKRKNIEVQDYAVSSAQFWTKKTNQILNLNVAQHLRNIKNMDAQGIYNLIKSQANGKVFPEDLDVSKKIVENVLQNRYELHGFDTVESYNDYIVQGLMDVPLDSIEVGDDIVSALSTPYISKRATQEDQIGVSRYEMFQKNNPHMRMEYKDAYELTDKMYTKEMYSLAKEVLAGVESKLPEDCKLHDQYGNATPYGKYVIPLLTSEIAKFAIIKAVDPKASFSFNSNTGEISYDYNSLKGTSLLGMGIIADSPENEAISLVNHLRKGIRKINASDKEKLASALLKSIKGTNFDSFKLAEMIVDRTQAGLDWRIDATKDIGDIESLRNKKTDFEYTWNKVIDFWSKFTDGVKEYHPDAYIAAEVTDLGEIYSDGYGDKSGARFAGKTEAMRKLLNEAGFTTTANYDYFSSDITKIFGKLFDFDGNSSPEKGYNQGTTILDKLVGSDNFLNSGSLESLIYSYTFAGNHDKCRALDGFSMDMDLVYTDLTEKGNPYRERAYRILNGVKYGENVHYDSVDNYNYDKVSNLAIAKCESIASGMGKAKEAIGLSDSRKNYVYDKMVEALKNLSNGYHRGKVFEADGFGARDYNIALDILFDEMDYIEPDSNNRLNAEEKKKLKDKTLERIIDPAMSKLLGQTKFLTALVGNPTLFAGDEYGATGYETTTKNIYLQNRNVIHEDWADPNSPNYKEFVKKHKDNMMEALSLRSRPELQPLNDGTPFALKEQNAHYKFDVYKDDTNKTKENFERTEEGDTQISALLRQSPNGAMTISLFNTAGLNHTFDKYYDPAELTLKCIDLNEDRGGKVGLRGGLKSGMKFKNADKNDPTTYYVNDKNQITGPDQAPIKFKDSTLILYHEPSFTGRRVLYNPQYNIVSNPYSQVNKEKQNIGNKLALLSK